MKILEEIKDSPFVYPKKRYYLGNIVHGTPYMTPAKFCETGIKIRKEKPKYNRNRSFTLFGYNISYGWPIFIKTNDLGWKDKFNSPRYEWPPAFYIFFFKWQFCIWWNAPTDDENEDLYWEMFLWYKYYSNSNLKKAEDSWRWINSNTKKSTWNKEFYIKEIRDIKLTQLLKNNNKKI